MYINKTKLILYIVLIFISLLVIIIGFLSFNSAPPKTIIIPTPTISVPTISFSNTSSPPIPQRSTEYIKSSEKIHQEEQKILEEHQAVIAFRESLPYQGKTIRIEYNIQKNTYKILMNKQFKIEGEKELKEVLRSKSLIETTIDIERVYQ